MRKKAKIIIPGLLLLAVVAVAGWYLAGVNIPVVEPAGEIGRQERNLIIVALLLSAIVVMPVYLLTIMIAMKYRESNHTSKTKYRPDWDSNRLFEGLWWAIPIVIIGILSVITWRSSHALDPYKPLASVNQPVTVQVVALDWKWLFIYPKQHTASVNLVEFPVNTPVNFQLTSDAIMNSFWIPQLGSQIYAMPGMSTQLHLMADRTGSFLGSPANIAGEGFARMDFTAKSVSGNEFNKWTHQAAGSKRTLSAEAYAELAKPSMSLPVAYYSNVPAGFYNRIVSKYMAPAGSHSVMPGMEM